MRSRKRSGYVKLSANRHRKAMWLYGRRLDMALYITTQFSICSQDNQVHCSRIPGCVVEMENGTWQSPCHGFDGFTWCLLP